jgi:hypothetical protein
MNMTVDKKSFSFKPRLRGNVLISDNYSQTIITFCDATFQNFLRHEKQFLQYANFNNGDLGSPVFNHNLGGPMSIQQQQDQICSILLGQSNLLSVNSP